MHSVLLIHVNISDLSSPKFTNKKYPWLNASDVAHLFEDDDSISVTSGDSSLDSLSVRSCETGQSMSSIHSGRSSHSDSVSCLSIESGPVRSGRTTPRSATPTKCVSNSAGSHSTQNESLQNSPARNTRARNSPARKTPTKNTLSRNILEDEEASKSSCSSAKKSETLVENKDLNRVKNTNDDIVQKRLADKGAKTPERKRNQVTPSQEEVLSVKKCRTEPRRKSLQPQVVLRKSPKTEVKVRRAQSVRIKRFGNEYQSFRDQTPDSSGPKTRTRLSDRFQHCTKVEEIKRSGREAFTVITNRQSPVVSKCSAASRQSVRDKKSPKVRTARQK